MSGDRQCVCRVVGEHARMIMPTVVDLSVAQRLRRHLLSMINTLPDHVAEVASDLSNTEVVDDAGATAIASLHGHALRLELQPRNHAATPQVHTVMNGEQRGGLDTDAP
ncbi:hypothetical protein [Embleya scabrispora]|uniref:hypothetical protein n=1 Tax=Embleya scabrispora TaxID=159449 RepID=UPI0003A1F0CD|nr:hypothetical protein [Embleya scabrispora]MYS87736.1 hypothetical protein [Streptomyces sp. SID5474]